MFCGLQYFVEKHEKVDTKLTAKRDELNRFMCNQATGKYYSQNENFYLEILQNILTSEYVYLNEFI